MGLILWLVWHQLFWLPLLSCKASLSKRILSCCDLGLLFQSIVLGILCINRLDRLPTVKIWLETFTMSIKVKVFFWAGTRNSLGMFFVPIFNLLNSFYFICLRQKKFAKILSSDYTLVSLKLISLNGFVIDHAILMDLFFWMGQVFSRCILIHVFIFFLVLHFWNLPMESQIRGTRLLSKVVVLALFSLISRSLYLFWCIGCLILNSSLRYFSRR